LPIILKVKYHKIQLIFFLTYTNLLQLADIIFTL